jgi:flavin reductase (DIM6/NTAB) family NADH-FMN oxidoreductase RutF
MAHTTSTARAEAVMPAALPTLDSRALRRCLGLYPTGVTVVTTSSALGPVGMAVNSFAAVSLEPPLVLWSIRKASRSEQAFLAAKHFAINILAAEQVQVSRMFGSGHEDRFNANPWHMGEAGAPLLQGALAHLECRRWAVYEGGDHHVVLGEVLRHGSVEGPALVFAQGQYAGVQALAQEAAPSGPSSASADADAAGPTTPPLFLRLLSEAQQRLSAQFEAHREALGVSTAGSRILSRLDEGACGAQELQRATYLGQRATEDALHELLGAGFVVQHDGLLSITTAGAGKRRSFTERLEQFTREKLSGVSAEDIAAARRVLSALRQSEHHSDTEADPIAGR